MPHFPLARSTYPLATRAYKSTKLVHSHNDLAHETFNIVRAHVRSCDSLVSEERPKRRLCGLPTPEQTPQKAWRRLSVYKDFRFGEPAFSLYATL
jgi:hypothetical protein